MQQSYDDIFKKFSDSARKILAQSQRIARDMGSGINSEHLLLALVTTPGTIAYELLQDYFINVDQIRLILSLRGRETTLQTGISPFAKRILEFAASSAHQYEHVKIDAEHILLGIVSYPDCLAYQIVSRIGIDPPLIRKQILKLFDELQSLDQHVARDTHSVDEGIDGDFSPHAPKEFQNVGAPRMAHAKKPQKQSILEYFGTNLTDLALQGKLDPVIGREPEIQRLIQILARRTKNNPALIGEPGVGKTAIVEGLAKRIADGKVPRILSNRQIYQLDLALLIAGTTYRGQFEERLKKVMAEIKKNPRIIIFIDELHTLVGAGSAEGTMDAANIIKPALSRGEIRLIGATTLAEYRKHIEKDAALERRLQRIIVPEPTLDETLIILDGIKKNYEDYHHVTITDDAIKAAAIYSQRFIQDRFLPDKAIDLIDEASSAVHLHRMPSKLTSMNIKKLSAIVTKKELALASHNLEEASLYRKKESELSKIITDADKKLYNIPRDIVNEESIAKIVTMWTGIPVGSIIKEEQDRLRNLEKTLQQTVIGQNEAIKIIASTIRRAKAGISNPSRPLGSFLFLGPTGVGKTYLTQTLAKTIYGSDSALIKIDMSEFMERHNISRLTGAPPGYVGYEEAGKLTESIRRQPFSVVLFDEVEKAHPDVFNLLLQILEDGQLTDASGRLVSFRHAIVILTSNIGTDTLTRKAVMGFHAHDSKIRRAYDDAKIDISKELSDHFRPEFLNRLDKTIYFEPLGERAVAHIVVKELELLSGRVAGEGYTLTFKPAVIDYLVKHGYDPHFGARPLKRAITEYIEDKLADLLLSGFVARQSDISVDVHAGKIIVTQKKGSHVRTRRARQRM